MIKKIHLENVQAHKDTTIEPAESLTSITGQSDQGKTTVIRGVKKVRDNRPLGKGLVRHGESNAVVAIDNVSIVFGHKTAYVVDNAEPLSALNRSVPEEVTERLQLGPDNIQEQHESIFLLNETPGKVAQKISELADLDQAHGALTYIAHLKRKTSSEVDVIQKSIDQNTHIIDELEFIEHINEEYTKIERKRLKAERLGKKHTELYNATQNVIRAKIRLSEIPNVGHLFKQLEGLQKLTAEVVTLKSEASRVRTLIDKAQQAGSIAKVEPSYIIGKIVEAEEMYYKMEKVKSKIKLAKYHRENLAEVDAALEALQEEWAEHEGDNCPLCGGEI